jgi:hypothetical protein
MQGRAVALVAGLLIAASAAAQLATQKSTQNGVTVAATPAHVVADAGVWIFNIVLDTHSQYLSDDLASTAVLVDNRGREAKPLAWEGAGPGGHHRAGVLKFPALEPFPRTVELRIKRAGEAHPRTFLWQLR